MVQTRPWLSSPLVTAVAAQNPVWSSLPTWLQHSSDHSSDPDVVCFVFFFRSPVPVLWENIVGYPVHHEEHGDLNHCCQS